MYKKIISLLLIVVLSLSLFVGCGEENSEQEPVINDDNEDVEQVEEPKEQILKFILGEEPEVIDPGLAADSSPSPILINTFEGLVGLDNTDNPIPGTAENWEISKDGLEYTFYIREDAKWSDGKPVVAQDFEYAWKRVIDPSFAADYSWMMVPYIKNAEKYYNGECEIEDVGIEVINDKTIKVTLEQPTPYMLELFSFWTYYPVRKDIVEQDDQWHRKADTYICNGPFYISEMKFGESMTLTKNEHYWAKDEVKLSQIRYDFVSDSNTALSAYEAGEVDGIAKVPTSEIPRLKTDSEGFWVLPKLQHIYLVYNVKEAPFDDVRVRKALALAIDRKAITETILQGGEMPASGLIPPGIKYGGKDFREEGGSFGISPKAQVEEAKKLLAEAGYPNGEGFPVVQFKENGKKYVEAIAQMWKDNLNIEVELVTREWKTHIKELKALDHTVASAGWTGDYLHPMTFLEMYTPNSGVNYTNWESDEYTELIRKTQSEQNVEKQLEYMHKAEEIFMSDMPICPIYYSTTTMMMNPKVKNWRKSPLGYLYLSRAYIEE